MLDFIKKFFRYRAKSAEEFVRVIHEEGCKSVLVEPTWDTRGGSKTGAVGAIGVSKYLLGFTTVAPNGRRFIYREFIFDRFGSERGFGDAEERRDAAIKLFLVGEKKVKELQEKLPGVSVDLIGPGGQAMDDAGYKKLHEAAVACGVSA